MQRSKNNYMYTESFAIEVSTTLCFAIVNGVCIFLFLQKSANSDGSGDDDADDARVCLCMFLTVNNTFWQVLQILTDINRCCCCLYLEVPYIPRYIWLSTQMRVQSQWHAF